MVLYACMKQRGHTINGSVLRLCRTRLLGVDAKPTIDRAARMIDVTPALWSQWELGGRRISDEKLEMLVDMFGLESADPLLASSAFAAEAEAERQRQRRNKPVAA